MQLLYERAKGKREQEQDQQTPTVEI